VNKTRLALRTDILYRLGDSKSENWSAAEINSYIQEGYNHLVRAVNLLWDITYLNDSADIAEYALPTDLLMVDRVTWNWKRIEPLSHRQLRGSDGQYRSTSGSPEGYTLDEDGLETIRLWPVPSVSISPDPTDEEFDEDPNNTRVEYFKRATALSADTDSFKLTDAHVRYLRFFALWKALERQGDGQDLKLAEHYKARYFLGVQRIGRRQEDVKRARVGRMGGEAPRGGTIPRPRLPAHYGATVRYNY